ncbi:MAG: hypothetical protein CMM93_03225 [Rickettsiales bacterium]|nr:hypothetical protein [Rickettsiales bacterium]|tara:strand:- start:494 stop:1654 length:1161 start_codon:yes stop_codon:yes gene_type:complete
MLREIKRANEKDLEFIKQIDDANTLLKHAHLAGSIEMFQTILDRVVYYKQELMSPLLENSKYEFARRVLRKEDLDSIWELFKDSYSLIQCLPESLEFLKWSGIKEHPEFAKELVFAAIEQNCFDPKYIVSTLAIDKETYLHALSCGEAEGECTSISDDCIEYLPLYQYNSDLTVIVRTGELENANLELIKGCRLYFKMVYIPPKEVIDEIATDCITNPYFMTKYECTAKHVCWKKADWNFLSQHSKVNFVFDEDGNYVSLRKMENLLKRCENGVREELDRYNQSWEGRESELYKQIGSNEFLPLLFCLINHSSISHHITGRMLHQRDFYAPDAFQFVNWEVIGPYLKYIPFSIRQMKEIVKLNKNLYIHKNSAIKYKPLRLKSARK